MRHFILIISSILFLFACDSDTTVSEVPLGNSMFTQTNAKETGIEFSNDLRFDREFNIYTYRNFYNGGGVAIGDVNNDGLADVYFTSNMDKNKLFLNKGSWKFEDVTSVAAVDGESAWSTGVSMVDINADGWLDIYVCNSGDVEGDNKKNELFINNQDGTFSEQAKEYGLADEGYSTHSAFFDYDKDGDLDMYLLNNSYRAINSFNPKVNIRDVRDAVGGDKLYKNEGGAFVDVSVEAGIYGSEIGFGLGVTVGDIDQDGWDDLYISNDFFEKDYIYMNNGDGTFTEDLENQMKSISVASMGADMADLNNDGYSEIFVTEMLPIDDRRIKTKTTFEDWDKYQANIKNGYYHQFTRNMLHLNNKDKSFSEVGRFAGVEASDWSWGALLADFDNDGLRDIFVANGINRDLTDQDFINFLSSEETMKKMTVGNKVNFKELIEVIPSERIPNMLFVNQGKMQFVDRASEYGLGTPSHSNGAAYGDLDNDGDLDLIVNNVNMPAFVYRNDTEKKNCISFDFVGKGQNTKAIGTKVSVHLKDEILYSQFMPTKGFQSSMDYKMHFGLGEASAVDSIMVQWPNGVRAKLNKEVNVHHTLTQPQGTKPLHLLPANDNSDRLLTEYTLIDESHQENKFVDFDRDRLLYHMITSEGPKCAVGDLNGDGQDDLFLCGSKGYPSSIYFQKSGKFVKTNKKLLEQTKEGEDRDVSFVDVDRDGDLDIYVARGGNEFNNQSSDIIDLMYLNNGKGQFTIKKGYFPTYAYLQTAAVSFDDIDGDKDVDGVFVERLKSFQYGVPTRAFIADAANAIYTVQATGKDISYGFNGMFTDIETADLDGDGIMEVITCGKYLPISVFKRTESGWSEIGNSLGLENTEGWWNTIALVDIDKDGDQDIIAGNHGTNSRFRASLSNPLCLHVNDYDGNGSVEQIMCNTVEGQSYPMILRHDLIKQLPHLKKRFLKYESYANKSIDDIFSEEERKKMLTLKVYEMETCLYINDNGKFTKNKLPELVNYSPVYALHTPDLNGDGHLDIVMGGNLYEAKPEIGRYDSSQGIVLLADGVGGFSKLPSSKSGFKVEGQIRDIEEIRISKHKHLVVTRNNDKPLFFKLPH